jgi:tRNA (mo5U34)-methyltransferase
VAGRLEPPVDRPPGDVSPLRTDPAALQRSVPLVDALSDEDLLALNSLLPWKAFTLDGCGRRFGAAAWAGKRDQPQPIPDRRIALMDARFGLAGKRVLEVGCFEGIHTIGLCRLGAVVTAVDGRIENVLKTIVRTALYQCHPCVFKHDLERTPGDAGLLGADLMHHVGVLYHLRDPVSHLLDLGRYIGSGIMLDTHYADQRDARRRYEVAGRSYRYKEYRELGRKDVFSGLYPHSKWLLLETIVDLLRTAGFDTVEVAETRQERNGPRALLFASRASPRPVPPGSPAELRL